MTEKTDLTVSISPYSADELVRRVATQLSEDTQEAIGEKVEEILGESIEALVRAKLDDYLSRTVERLVADHYTPVSEEGDVGEKTTLDDHIRKSIASYIFEPCNLNVNRGERKIVTASRDSYNRPDGKRYDLMVKEMSREAAAGLVNKEVAQHTAKMKEDATEAVKALVAEHIVKAAEKRQLSGGLPG